MASKGGSAALLGPLLVVSGRATQPAIADLEEDKVLVEAWGSENAVIVEEAQFGCAIHARRAVPLSSWCLEAVCSDCLFACQE